jgi:hypothetical protein
MGDISPTTGNVSGLIFLNEKLAGCYRKDSLEDLIPWPRRDCSTYEVPTKISGLDSQCYAHPIGETLPRPRLCAPSLASNALSTSDEDDYLGWELVEARWDMPESFSVLLNFGPDGEMHIFFASWEEGEINGRCGA